MPILPIIDLLILMGSGLLVVGFVLKSIALTTSYSASIFGFTSMDFVVMTGVCLGFALALAARSWVRLNEARLFQQPRSYASKQAPVFQAEAERLEDDEYAAPPMADLAGGRRL